MRVRLPHSLEKAEIRRRLDERKDEIVDYFPPGMASIESRWKGEDRMEFIVAVAGQRINGAVGIGETHVVIDVDLPLILSFLGRKIEASVKKEGTRLLA